MDRELTIKALADWNFWYRDQFTGVQRGEYVGRILSILDSWYVASVLGVKRAGKSTILNQVVKRLIERGTDPFNVLIVNFEDGRFSWVKSAEDLFRLYDIYHELRSKAGKSSSKPYVFLDEVQRVKGWEGFVRSLIDRREARVAVSGSTSDLLDDEVRRRLAGRHVVINVYPLSFREFLRFKGAEVRDETDIIVRGPEIRALFDEYLLYGGFPGVVNSSVKGELLASLYEDILVRDVITPCRIRDEGKLRLLSLYYTSNSGNRVRLRAISRQLEIPLRTVQRFTECLVRANLVRFVPALSPKLSVMARAERKVYAIDQGIANVVGYRLNPNLGALLENLIFVELLRRFGEGKIFYYRGRNEVDFVVVEGNEVKEAYQVAYELTERELKGAYELAKWGIDTVIITYDEEGEVEHKGRRFRVAKAWKWLLGL